MAYGLDDKYPGQKPFLRIFFALISVDYVLKSFSFENIIGMLKIRIDISYES